jgi:hypothetical protein
MLVCGRLIDSLLLSQLTSFHSAKRIIFQIQQRENIQCLDVAYAASQVVVFPSKAESHTEFVISTGFWIPAYAGKTGGRSRTVPRSILRRTSLLFASPLSSFFSMAGMTDALPSDLSIS